MRPESAYVETVAKGTGVHPKVRTVKRAFEGGIRLVTKEGQGGSSREDLSLRRPIATCVACLSKLGQRSGR